MADHAFTYVEQWVAVGAQKVALVHVQDKTKLEQHLKERLEEFIAHYWGRLEDLEQSLLKKGPQRSTPRSLWHYL